MKILIIGGTGTISTPITQKLLIDHDVTLLNRGNKSIEGVNLIQADINDEAYVSKALEGQFYDVVINFIVFTQEAVKRDIRLFKGKTNQYIFISTNVVLNHHDNCEIDETIEKGNRISLYGQEKARCENILLNEEDFPVTIVRPSHTYSNNRYPVSVKGNNTWTVIHRLINNKPILVHDSGQSIWPITHANDFARLFVSLVGNKKAINEIYHIVNPQVITWDMIYQEIAKQLGVVYQPVYVSSDILGSSEIFDFNQAIEGDKKFSNIFNIDKILEFNPGFEFEIDYKKGFSLFLEFMDSHPELKVVETQFDEWSDQIINFKNEMINKFKKERL